MRIDFSVEMFQAKAFTSLYRLLKESKMTKQTWSTPSLKNYGPASKITQQNNVDFNKRTGTGDSVLLIVNDVPTTINVPNGGSLIDITNNGVSVP